MAGPRYLFALFLAPVTLLMADQVIIKSAANGEYLALAPDGALAATAPTADSAEPFEQLYSGNAAYLILKTAAGSYVAFPDQMTPSATAKTPRAANLLSASAPRASDQAITLQLHATGLFLVAAPNGAITATAIAATGDSTWFILETVKSTTPYITIDFTDPRQTIQGFGAAVAYYGNWLTAHPNKQDIYNALFDPVNGLGMSVLRVQNIYTDASNPNFDPDVPQIVAAAAAIQGAPISIEMSSWSPPANLKSNQSQSCAGTQNCTLASSNGAFNYAGFATYWTDSLNAYASLGVHPTWISLQNEPDWIASYASCRFDPTEDVVGGIHYASYGKALDAVSNAVAQLPMPPIVIGPEVLGIGYNDVPNYMAQLNTSQLGAVAHHLYHGGSETAPDSFNPIFESIATNYSTLPRFMTEFGDGVSSSTNAGTAFETAWLIHNSLAVEEVSLYAYWGAIWPDHFNLIYVDNPFVSQLQWAAPQGWMTNDYYYALEHFSRFVRPGYVRFSAWTNQAGLRVSAFEDDKRGHRNIVVVALNTASGAPVDAVIDFKGIADSKSQVYRSSFGDATERFASIGPLDKNNAVEVPSQGAVTAVIDLPGVSRTRHLQ